jgi:hypothetical protein
MARWFLRWQSYFLEPAKKVEIEQTAEILWWKPGFAGEADTEQQ